MTKIEKHLFIFVKSEKIIDVPTADLLEPRKIQKRGRLYFEELTLNAI